MAWSFRRFWAAGLRKHFWTGGTCRLGASSKAEGHPPVRDTASTPHPLLQTHPKFLCEFFDAIKRHDGDAAVFGQPRDESVAAIVSRRIYFGDRGNFAIRHLDADAIS